jgi:DNA-binding LytR/AlgR family response regulator
MPGSPPLSCVIIDDDAASRLTLSKYIGLTQLLTLTAVLTDGAEGLDFLRSGHKVDLLFLDVEMPNLSGLDLLRILHDPPQVVLVTSHEHFAVTAFDLRVTDYLVKPVSFARFCQAVDRVLQTAQLTPTSGPEPAVSESELAEQEPAATSPNGTAAEIVPTPTDPSNLFVKVNNKLVRLKFDDIIYVEAMSVYVNIVTTHHKYVVSTTLKALAAKLVGTPFLRVHRSFMLNMTKVEHVENNAAYLEGGHEVPIGVSYQEDFFKQLNQV